MSECISKWSVVVAKLLVGFDEKSKPLSRSCVITVITVGVRLLALCTNCQDAMDDPTDYRCHGHEALSWSRELYGDVSSYVNSPVCLWKSVVSSTALLTDKRQGVELFYEGMYCRLLYFQLGSATFPLSIFSTSPFGPAVEQLIKGITIVLIWCALSATILLHFCT